MHNFGNGQAIAHSGRSLAPAEKNYGQVEKEALALVWAAKSSIDTCMEKDFSLSPTTSLFSPSERLI